MPFGPAGSALSFRGDVLLLIYLLALARFCTAWAALETGSALEGMGAAREVSYAVLAEAAMVTAVLSLSVQTGSVSLSTMLAPSAGAGAVLLAAGLFTVLLIQAVLPLGQLSPLAAAVLAVAAGVGLVESLLARLAFRRVPLLLTTAFLLCLFALLVAWKGGAG